MPTSRLLGTSLILCHTCSPMARPARAIPLRVGPQGRVVIPAEMRRELEIEPGETLMAHVESHRLVLERREEILERLRSELRGARSSRVSAVDELIAERRAEARREAAEHERRA
jgi:AbrB family looped-hinge helix DNA binding protein